MAKVISLINMKGGVGKSTLTVNLAWHLAAYTSWSKKVLVVDLDPQFNASQYLVGVEQYQKLLDKGKPTVWEIFEQGTTTPKGKVGTLDPYTTVHPIVRYANGSRVELIPSRLELAFSLRNPNQKEGRLAKAINKLSQDYDVILIDCPPTESIFTTAAYLSSDYLLVPVKPEYLSSIGLPLLANSLGEFEEQYDKHVEIAGIVFNGCSDYSPEESKAKKEVRDLAKARGWYVFENEVQYSRSYPKGAREGKPIFGTSYARTHAASNFRGFVAEFAKRVGL